MLRSTARHCCIRVPSILSCACTASGSGAGVRVQHSVLAMRLRQHIWSAQGCEEHQRGGADCGTWRQGGAHAHRPGVPQVFRASSYAPLQLPVHGHACVIEAGLRMSNGFWHGFWQLLLCGHVNRAVQVSAQLCCGVWAALQPPERADQQRWRVCARGQAVRGWHPGERQFQS
jgi:hypothetical protein